ncbi:hypothetical protein [Bacteroides clarus]|uniref:hypothetical protein n=1 Tax=Bacteroides clarus TaxID=626929 RepID=UPI0011DD4BCB|nr:hypothetical protein [Bacteroides clarus]
MPARGTESTGTWYTWYQRLKLQIPTVGTPATKGRYFEYQRLVLDVSTVGISGNIGEKTYQYRMQGRNVSGNVQESLNK